MRAPPEARAWSPFPQRAAAGAAEARTARPVAEPRHRRRRRSHHHGRRGRRWRRRHERGRPHRLGGEHGRRKRLERHRRWRNGRCRGRELHFLLDHLFEYGDLRHHVGLDRDRRRLDDRRRGRGGGAADGGAGAGGVFQGSDSALNITVEEESSDGAESDCDSSGVIGRSSSRGGAKAAVVAPGEDSSPLRLPASRSSKGSSGMKLPTGAGSGDAGTGAGKAAGPAGGAAAERGNGIGSAGRGGAEVTKPAGLGANGSGSRVAGGDERDRGRPRGQLAGGDARRPRSRRRRSGGSRPGLGRAAQQLADLGDQRLGLEGLREEAVASDAIRPILVERLERPREKENGNVGEGRRLLDELADLVAVLLGHDDVAENHVRTHFLDPLHGEPAVAHRDHVEVLVGESQLDDLLDRDAVVRQKDLLAHHLS